MSILPVARACELAQDEPELCWLIDGLWAKSTVGIVGGEPKCCKSFLALDIAVALTSGRPCLGKYSVPGTGRVLLYAAEDAPGVVRRRLEGISEATGCALEDLDIQIITSPSLRLDLEADQGRLERTIEHYRPQLLILDPFVRLHRVDENISSEVVPILSYLRGLQRSLGCAVVLVHHAKKGGGKIRAGQALRGSSELHAWTDTILYLRRKGEDEIDMTIEHRAAASEAGIKLELQLPGPRLVCRDQQHEPSTRERVEAALRELNDPISLNQLRARLRIRTATLSQVLTSLVAAGQVERTDRGYALR